MHYLAAYDLENVQHCVEAGRAVAALHKRRRLPATFFVVGRCLEEHGPALREILDDELFDLQTHTYSHALLKDSAVHGPGAAEKDAEREIREGIRLVRDVLGRTVRGLRSPCGFDGGLKGRPGLLAICAEAGLAYVSTDARGPGDSLPAPLKRPYTYAGDGYPDLWELPVQGWHDNVLKGFVPNVAFLTYPFGEPWHVPPQAPQTPEEHGAHHLVWVDKALEAGLPYVSPAFHPWSMVRFDPRVGELDVIIDGLERRGIGVVTATQTWRMLAEEAPADADA